MNEVCPDDFVLNSPNNYTVFEALPNIDSTECIKQMEEYNQKPDYDNTFAVCMAVIRGGHDAIQ